MIEILAPAKINLGLEIMGRRADGYHDLRTLFCTVALFDKITVRPSPSDHIHIDVPELQHVNLVVRAVREMRSRRPDLPPATISIRKRIPVAAGLGGASSDAAASLIGLNQLLSDPLAGSELDQIASLLGSDVPFLLRGGLARGQGRGELLTPLPFHRIFLVLISPILPLSNKTATMFGQIELSDYSNGGRMQELEQSIASDGLLPLDQEFPNPFRRALYHLFPELQAVAEQIAAVACRPVQVTGAGPSLFVLAQSAREAHSLRTDILKVIRARLPSTVHVLKSVRSIPLYGCPNE